MYKQLIQTGRFAPSPSGQLHIGNLSSSLLAWLDARSVGGRLIFRMEDLDPDRSSRESEQSIMHALKALGLDRDEGYPDAGYSQSQRNEKYDEVFDLLKNTEMTINIELKNGIVQYKNLEKKVLALVEEYDMLDRIWCSSFNHESIVRMKKLCPDMRCGLLFSDIIVNPAEYASELHVDALHPATYHMQDENYIDKAHGRGLRAHVWTVNEKHEMKALVKVEADAIITNYPDIAVEIVKNA